MQGVLAGMLIGGALNAVSYFFRSTRGGNLLGTAPGNREALGFPVEMWEAGNLYGGYFVDYQAAFLNVLFAAGLGVVCGALVLTQRALLDRLVAKFGQPSNRPRPNFQFSLRAMLVVMVLVAVGAAAARSGVANRPGVLAGIYAIGPWLLVLIAFLPRGIPYQQRVAILIPLTFALILGAVFIGSALKTPLEFDKVLMGIFISWVPQSALAATCITLAVLFRYRHLQDPPA